MCEFCWIPRLPHEVSRPIPASAMGYKDKYWEPGSEFTVSVLRGTPQQIEHVMAAASFWSAAANVSFRYLPKWENAMCRIQTAPNQGSFSYIGTDNALIHQELPTMNLAWIDRDIARGDFSVCIHEFGHFLGLGHEHQNPNEPFKWNRDQVVKDLSGPPNNWSISQIEHNVLKQVPVDEVDATTLDRESIMMYFFPDSWVLDGKGTKRNTTLSVLDKQFISLIYPSTGPKKTDPEVWEFLSELLYDKRRADFLNKKQIIACLKVLGDYYDPKHSTRFLREKLKAWI